MKYGRHKTNLWFVWSLLMGAISRKILEVKSTTIAAASAFWTSRAGTLKMSGTFNFATECAVGLNVLEGHIIFLTAQGVGAGGAIGALPGLFTESTIARSGWMRVLLSAVMASLPFSRATVAAPFISARSGRKSEFLDFRKVVQIAVPRSSPSR
jgi:hypothetical protein